MSLKWRSDTLTKHLDDFEDFTEAKKPAVVGISNTIVNQSFI